MTKNQRKELNDLTQIFVMKAGELFEMAKALAPLGAIFGEAETEKEEALALADATQKIISANNILLKLLKKSYSNDVLIPEDLYTTYMQEIGL